MNFRFSKAVTVVAFFVTLAAAACADDYGADSVREYRKTVANKVETGTAHVHNDYVKGADGRITFALYHADKPDVELANWTLDGGFENWIAIQDKQFVIGLDWGVQVRFGNGVMSEIRMLNDIATVDGGKITVRASAVHTGIKPKPPMPKNQNQPNPAPQGLIFPLTATATHNIQQAIAGTGSMKSDIILHKNGNVILTTRTWTKVKLNGFTGGVRILILTDDDGWLSPEWKYGVDGTLLGRSDRTDVQKIVIPKEIAAKAKSVAILHCHAPRVKGPVEGILNGAKTIRELYDGLKKELGPMIVELVGAFG